MTKLKLEDLQVTSFATTSDAAGQRGTVLGAARTNRPGGCPGPIETYNVDACGETQYFDCSLGCSINTNCPNGCIEA
jgi:hypothetical protein